MTRYPTAMLQTWDDSVAVSTTARVPRRVDSSHTATTTPIPSQGISIWVSDTLPKWFELARDALIELYALPPNWNSYSARRIDITAVTDAVGLLMAAMDDGKPLPTFVPVASGGVLLEWHTMSADLEVTVLPNRRANIVFEKVNEAPIEVQGLAQEVAAPLKAFLQQI